MSERVELRFDDGLARLTLTRADARNAIDPAMVEALAEAVECVANEPNLRALLITAAGPAFSVGGDLRYLGSRTDRLPDELEPMVRDYHETLAQLAELLVPVVCAAKGAVAGGALGLLWCSDVAIIAEDAKLAPGFLELGLSADGGSTWWLPRLVGLQRARRLPLSQEPITGATAAEWGLVACALPEPDVDEEAERVARALAAAPAKAYGEIRGLLANTFARDLREGLGAEHEAILRTAATGEARERVGRFEARRGVRY